MTQVKAAQRNLEIAYKLEERGAVSPAFVARARAALVRAMDKASRESLVREVAA